MNALISAGGGSKGAHSAGVMWYVAMRGPYADFQYMSGVSVGSINTCGWAHSNDLEYAADRVKNLWFSIRKNSDIWRWQIPVPLFRYLPALWKDSLADTSPLRDFLERWIDPDAVRSTGIKCAWPAADLTTGSLRVFDESFPDMVSAIMASSAYPGMFPLVQIEDHWYSDGAIRGLSPIRGAIRAGCSRILCVLTHDPNKKSSNGRPRSVLARSKLELDARIDDALLEDILKCERKNLLIREGKQEGREIQIDAIWPSRPLGDSLVFDPSRIREDFNLGYSDARNYFNGISSSGRDSDFNVKFP